MTFCSFFLFIFFERAIPKRPNIVKCLAEDRQSKMPSPNMNRRKTDLNWEGEQRHKEKLCHCPIELTLKSAQSDFRKFSINRDWNWIRIESVWGSVWKEWYENVDIGTESSKELKCSANFRNSRFKKSLHFDIFWIQMWNEKCEIPATVGQHLATFRQPSAESGKV